MMSISVLSEARDNFLNLGKMNVENEVKKRTLKTKIDIYLCAQQRSPITKTYVKKFLPFHMMLINWDSSDSIG